MSYEPHNLPEWLQGPCCSRCHGHRQQPGLLCYECEDYLEDVLPRVQGVPNLPGADVRAWQADAELLERHRRQQAQGE